MTAPLPPEKRKLKRRPRFPPRPVPKHCRYVDSRGGCREHAGHGLFGNFCEDHAAYFAEIRTQLAKTGRNALQHSWDRRPDDDDAALAA